MDSVPDVVSADSFWLVIYKLGAQLLFAKITRPIVPLLGSHLLALATANWHDLTRIPNFASILRNSQHTALTPYFGEYFYSWTVSRDPDKKRVELYPFEGQIQMHKPPLGAHPSHRANCLKDEPEWNTEITRPDASCFQRVSKTWWLPTTPGIKESKYCKRALL